MTDDRRWFLQYGDGPHREVTKREWLQAEYGAGFYGGRMREPSTGAFSAGGVSGTICYPGEQPPPDAVTAPMQVSYEWGVQSLNMADVPGGNVVWESYTDNDDDAEGRARARVESMNRRPAEPVARLVRRRVETYGWEPAE